MDSENTPCFTAAVIQRMPDAPKETLYIIDGFAQIFRAYYALMGGMKSPRTGEPTNACFGMAGMFLKLFREFKPHYVVMAVESEGKTFRDDIYPAYKATRDAPPSDLIAQVPRIFQMSKLFGVPVLNEEGAEADDVIATLVEKTLNDPKHEGVDISIISKDKDLQQLIGPRVKMVDIHTGDVLDDANFIEKRGFTPQQVVDLLALMGDKVDNIPGVDGIGPKTAAKLLDEFGSIDGIYDNIEKIKGKRKENLLAAKDKMPLSKTLVTLKRDLALPFDMDDARVGAIDGTALRHLFEELGFNRHQRDLDALLEESGQVSDAPTSTTSTPTSTGFPTGLFDMACEGRLSDGGDETVQTTATADDCEYKPVLTRDELATLITEMRAADTISVDTETIGLGHDAALCGVCISIREKSGWYIPVISPEKEKHLDKAVVLRELRPILEDPDVGKTGHNLKYDLLVLRHEGVHMSGVVFDSMIASHMLGMNEHGQDQLAPKILNHEMVPISALIGPKKRGAKQNTMDTVPLDQITPYAAEDADISLRLYEYMRPKIDESGMNELADRVEMPLVEVLADMEFNGIRLNPDELDRQKAELQTRIDELRNDIFGAMGGKPINLESTKQLGEVLFKELKFPVIKKTKTGFSTDMEVLEKLAEREDVPDEHARLPLLLLEYRQLTKLVNTYLGNLVEAMNQKDGRIHASFHQTGAATGRLSSSNPNLQNIPIRTDIGRQIRKAFVAEDGMQLIAADYSQIELRILAHLSKDAGLTEAFKAGQDIHAAVAARVFDVSPEEVTGEQRSSAKVINFGIIYGITPFGLARRIDNLDVKAAKALIDDYRERFPGIDGFMRQCVDHAINHGFVSTIMGRRRTIPQITSANPQVRSLGERLAINSVVQGSAADLIKLAMVNLHRRIGKEKLPLKLLLQIHDELVLESPATNAGEMSGIVQHEMETAMDLSIPLRVDAGVGDNWLEAK